MAALMAEPDEMAQLVFGVSRGLLAGRMQTHPSNDHGRRTVEQGNGRLEHSVKDMDWERYGKRHAFGALEGKRLRNNLTENYVKITDGCECRHDRNRMCDDGR